MSIAVSPRELFRNLGDWGATLETIRHIKRLIPVVGLALVAGALFWTLRGGESTAGKDDPVIEPKHINAPTAETRSNDPLVSQEALSTVDQDPLAEAPDTSHCAAEITAAEEALNRYDDERLRAVTIEDTDFEVYRSLGVLQLEQLAAQGDATAMVVLGVAQLVSEIGLEDTDTVPLVMGEIDTKGLDDNLNARETLPPKFRAMADWMYEAAIHGKLEAFQEIGEPLKLAGASAVTLGWVDVETFRSLSDSERRRLEPETVYAAAYYLLDPNLRGSLEEPYDEWLPQFREQYGAQFDTVVQPLADRFIADVHSRGRSMPEIAPPVSLSDYLHNAGSDCQPE